MSDPSGEERRVSYSQLTTYRECPQRWHYSYRMGLEAQERDHGIAADAGTWWHALRAADDIRRGHDLGSLRHAPKRLVVGSGTLRKEMAVDPETITTGQVLGAAHQWWRLLTDETRDAWLDYLGEPLYNRLMTLDTLYRDRWAEDREHERPVAAELGWGRTLVPGVRLGGYIDSVLLDARRNLLIVRDYKTSKALGSQHVADDLMDSQLPFYAWGASEQVAAWGLGSIKATSYCRTRIVAPKTPVLTGAGALSKQVSDYDLTTYLDWASGPDGRGVPYGTEGETYASGPRKGEPKWGRYTADPKVVERLSTKAEREKWHQRTLSPISVHLVRSHLRAAADTAASLGEADTRAAECGEAARNFTWSCRRCDFASLCRAQLLGGPEGEYDPEDYGLTVRTKRGR